jgi:hypothetical protein
MNIRKYLGIIFTITFLILVYVFKFTLNFNKNFTEANEKEIKLSFELKEVSKEIGINHVHENSKIAKELSNIAPYITYVGASVSIVDLDNSGWYDIYLTTQKIGGKNHYYKNNRNGTFREIADELHISNVNFPYPSYRSIFVDLDKDGKKDLILLSYHPRIFKNTGANGFVEIKNPGIGAGGFYGGANMVELNQPGKLELLLSPYAVNDIYYHPDTNKISPDNFYHSTNGTSKSFYRNLGNGHFDSPKNFLNDLQHVGWGHSISIFDIRNSGKKDIWFPEDYGIDQAYTNIDNHHFSEMTKKAELDKITFGRNGMNAELGDVDNDNQPLIFVSHIFEDYNKLAGNNLFKWRSDNHFDQAAIKRGVQNCGWAWGAKFIDFDNSTFLDLIVNNSMISANPKKSYWYSISVLDALSAALVSDSKNWPAMNDTSLGGYQKSCLYLNDRKGNFVDVASKTPLNAEQFDRRGIATIDFKNNGSPSLVIANQKGRSLFFENTQKNKNQWIGFKFKGTKSNIDGWGAKVIIELEDKKITRELEPLNSYSAQSEDRLLIGLGENPKIKSIVVWWPSQIRQNVVNFKINQYNNVVE